MNTWSGQPEESARHWTPENCHKLGNVLLLLKCGTAAKREQAYQEFIELKRWFIEEEFDDYLNRLDDLRASMGSIPLRVLMEEIRGERAPVTGWKAKEGKAIDPVMLPEMEINGELVNINSPSDEYAIVVKPYLKASDIIAHHVDYDWEHESLMSAMREFNKGFSDIANSFPVVKPVTRYDLFITLIKRGYHALEM